MKKFIILILFSLSSLAHEMTPTYPTWSPSHIATVVKTQMQIFNKREDISYYEIEVFSPEWENLGFVSTYNILDVAYLETKKFDVYMTEGTSIAAEYICTTSKIRSEDSKQTSLASRICSRLK